MKKRWFALLLAAVMLLSAVPLAQAALPVYGCSEGPNGKHDWTGEDPGEPWCETSGYTYYYCSYCGESYMEVTAPPLGHDWGEWITLQSGNCFTPGREYRMCRRCGKEDYRETGYQHQFGPWTVDEPGTCIQPELQKRVCSRCGYVDWRYGELGDHLWGEWYVVKEPTANEPGVEKAVCVYSEYHVIERSIPPTGDMDLSEEGLAVALTVHNPTAPEQKQPGDMVYVLLTVANTGTLPWENSRLDYSLPYSVSNDHPDFSEWIPYAGKHFDPEESFSFYMGFEVTPEDIANGAVERNVFATVESLVTLKMVSTTVETVSIPLEPSPVSIELSASFEARPYSAGEVFEVQYTVTNTGTVPLTYLEHQGGAWTDEPDPLAGLPETLDPGETWTAPLWSVTLHSYEEEGAKAEDGLGYFGRGCTVSYVYPTPTGDTLAYDECFINLPMLQGEPVPPGTEGPRLSLDGVCVTLEPFYFDYLGETEDIQYLLTVTNTGSVPLEFKEVEVVTAQGVFTVDIGAIPLEPGEYITIPGENRFLESEKDELERLNIGFTAIGYTEEKAVRSNQRDFMHRTSGNPTPWDPGDTAMTVKKSVLSVPANGYAYTAGETVTYQIEVTNTGEIKVDGVPVCDNQYNMMEDVAMLHDLEPGETRAVTFDYTVTEEDVLNGHIYNVARAEWMHPITETSLTAWSNPVVVLTTSEEVPSVYGVYVELSFLEPPKNGSYYEEGEEVPIQVYWENQSDDAVYSVEVYDDLSYVIHDTADGVVFTAGGLAPGECGAYVFTFTVDSFSVMNGYVEDAADIVAFDRDGNPYYHSAVLLGPAGLGGFYSMTVFKAVVSAPANGEYYVEGEEISYNIRVANVGECTLEVIHLYDTLAPSLLNGIGSLPSLAPGEKRDFSFNYTVTAADVNAGEVVNGAVGTYRVPSGYVPVASKPVHSLTGGAISELIPPVTFTEGKESCTLTLTGVNDALYQYELAHCEKHAETARKAQEALSGAKTESGGKFNLFTAKNMLKAGKDSGLDAAKTLWSEEIDALYEELYQAAGSADKPAVVQERLAFYAFLEQEEARLLLLYPDGDQAAKAILGLMQEQCAELCYLRHHAPEARPDSVLSENIPEIPESGADERCARLMEQTGSGVYTVTLRLCEEHAPENKYLAGIIAECAAEEDAASAFQRGTRLWQAKLDGMINTEYRAAGAEGRESIAAWRKSLDILIAARRDLLTALYPDQPGTVNELLCRMMMTRMILQCAGK